MSVKMTTSLLVDAALAMANRTLVSMVLVRRGDHNNGAIFVKLDHPDGSASLESRVFDFDNGYQWSVVMGNPPVSSAEIDQRLDREISFDTDCWILAVDSAIGDNPLRHLE